MAVYAKKVSSHHKTFHNRSTIVATENEVTVIPIPDSITLCNGCNQNIQEGYLIYLGKRELKANQPYDYYCESCARRYFKGMVVV